MLPAVNISSVYRNPDTCWQHHAGLTGGMTHREPTSVNLVPLVVISMGRLSSRNAGLDVA
jgi:hypothetical protein